ncbi:hypothetical protein Tco_0435778 [Tanacetum coccineum]
MGPLGRQRRWRDVGDCCCSVLIGGGVTSDDGLVDETSVKGAITGGVDSGLLAWAQGVISKAFRKRSALRVNHFSSSLKAINPSLCIMSQSIPEQLNVDRREFVDAVICPNEVCVLEISNEMWKIGILLETSVILREISTKIFHIRVTGHWVKSTLVNLGRWSRDYLIGSFGIGLRGLVGYWAKTWTISLRRCPTDHQTAMQ